MNASSQFSLFGPGPGAIADEREAAAVRVRGMIDRLKVATEPFWRDEAAVILDDGAFQRAMRLVPEAEAQALWAEFDPEMERLYALRPQSAR